MSSPLLLVHAFFEDCSMVSDEREVFNRHKPRSWRVLHPVVGSSNQISPWSKCVIRFSKAESIPVLGQYVQAAGTFQTELLFFNRNSGTRVLHIYFHNTVTTAARNRIKPGTNFVELRPRFSMICFERRQSVAIRFFGQSTVTSTPPSWYVHGSKTSFNRSSEPT
jgi:hypothetical protein